MNQNTLEGTKKKIYQLLKILKYLTDSPVKSYDCKFAVKMALRNKMSPAEGELGRALKEVLEHYTIRGNFSKVRKELEMLGVKSIAVGENRFEFEYEGKMRNKHSTKYNRKY